jgi:hypothetical protein
MKDWYQHRSNPAKSGSPRGRVRAERWVFLRHETTRPPPGGEGARCRHKAVGGQRGPSASLKAAVRGDWAAVRARPADISRRAFTRSLASKKVRSRDLSWCCLANSANPEMRLLRRLESQARLTSASYPETRPPLGWGERVTASWSL